MDNRCIVCNRKLKDSENKIGPVCLARLNKFTKQEKAKKKAREVARKFKKDIAKNQINMFEVEVEESIND